MNASNLPVHDSEYLLCTNNTYISIYGRDEYNGIK